VQQEASAKGYAKANGGLPARPRHFKILPMHQLPVDYCLFHIVGTAKNVALPLRAEKPNQCLLTFLTGEPDQQPRVPRLKSREYRNPFNACCS
jgi:hypothetical protein